MINVQFMKPFYTKVTGSKLRLVFAYQYFTIIKDNDVYGFIPIEGKEIVVNLNTMQVENLSEVFVFQRGNRFIRLPLYQLLLVSNVHDHLMPLLDGIEKEPQTSENQYNKEVLPDEINQLISEIEQMNLKNLIDAALDQDDEELFIELSNKLSLHN